MSFRQRLTIGLAAFASLLATGIASAQTLDLLNDTRGIVWPPYHSDPNLDNLRITEINQRDCVYNPTVTFNLLVGTTTAAWGSANIEAWIGTACDMQANRTGTAATCVKIASTSVAEHVIKIPVQSLIQPLSGGSSVGAGGTGGTGGTAGAGGTGGSSGTGGTLGGLLTGGTGATGGTGGDLGTGGDIGTGGTLGSAGTLGFTAEISGAGGTAGLGGMAAAGGADGVSGSGATDGSAGLSTGGTDTTGGTGGTTDVTGGTGGTDATGGTSGTGGEITEVPSICKGDPTLSLPNNRTLFFLVLTSENAPPNGVTMGTTKTWTYQYDLVGPQAPTGVTAGIGENALVLKWTEAANVDTDLYQYRFLCDPPPNQPAGQIIGAAGDSGAGVDTGGENECSSAGFAEGQTLTQSVLDAYNCGDAQKTATNAEVDHLDNYQRYAMAVVAQDRFKNYGSVSNVTCATPEPVTDYYEAYRTAGGRGGGGFCSIIGAQRSSAVGVLGAFAALGLLFRRRARRREDRKDA